MISQLILHCLRMPYINSETLSNRNLQNRQRLHTPLAYWSSSQVFMRPYPRAFLCHLSSSATLTSFITSIYIAPLQVGLLRGALDRHDLFVLQARTSMAQKRAFAIIGPSLWNQLLPSTRSTLLTGEPSASFRSLKTAFFSLGLSHCKKRYINV